MASTAADLFIGKLVTILENEASSIAGIRDEVDDIKKELESMKSFLKDADEGKKALTEGEQNWVASVRDLAQDAEDIIEEFMYHTCEQKSGGRFAWWLHKTIHIPKNLWFRRKIAKKLQKISQTIKAIPERNQRYRVGAEERTSPHDNCKRRQNEAESSRFIQEEELVGIEGKKQTLMRWLMNKAKDQTLVSVVGMGGSGKTVLVAKTFNDQTVKRHFDCYAWITVSQTYVIDDLFRSLIKEFHQARKEQVPENLNDMSYRELLEMLVNYLESKRYLVVLDDVWDIKLWKEIRISLPDRQLGSRIMLTTRKEDVASNSLGVQSHVHHIQPLERNDAWELFSKKAFSTYHNKSCPTEFKQLAWELVEKCEGLPLAIVTLGGLMSSKESFDEWRKVYNRLNWHLSNDSLLEAVKSILLVSFNDLPYHLKYCFLYCSLFPEDYLLRRERLIRLWVAEGFVKHAKGFTPEEVAEYYLMELIFRSMLQVVERNETGRPKACKMHDLMRELAQSISEKEKFGAVYDGKDEEIGARRLSIQAEGEIKSSIGMSQLRTFLFFGKKSTLPSGFKFLRVLDLEAMPIYKLPDDLVYLFNLTYLNLRGTRVKELPKSIGRLRNLLTLDIRDTKIEALPTGISKLLNLRHLLMYRYTGDSFGFRYVNGTGVPSNIYMLKKLQLLSCVESEGNIIRLLKNMTQLKRIGITNVKERDVMDLCASIERMELLSYLLLMASDEEEFLQVNVLSAPPPHLRQLILVGKLKKVPQWFCSLQSLTYLYLHWSRLEEDLLRHLEALPYLGSLNLVNAYVGNEMRFNKGFGKLTALVLCNMPLLDKVIIEKGVMSNLKSLSIGSCMELETLPLGVECLTNLETLELESVPMQLIQSIREGGVDRPKVQHIPEINHFYSTTVKGRFYESLS